MNKAYEAGICIVAAAGNHVGCHAAAHVVYPARYSRVIAVCGVMADGRPYTTSRGRRSKATSDPTPHERGHRRLHAEHPWAALHVRDCHSPERRGHVGRHAAGRRGRRSLVREVQERAAARLASSRGRAPRPLHLGQAQGGHEALRQRHASGARGARCQARPRSTEERQPTDDSFAFFRVITGLGVAESPPREQMFNLELAQRWLVNEELQEIVPDPDAGPKLGEDKLRRFMEAVIEDEGASLALRRHVAARYPLAAGKSVPRKRPRQDVVPTLLPSLRSTGSLADPPFRRIRVYAVRPELLDAARDRLDQRGRAQDRWET